MSMNEESDPLPGRVRFIDGGLHLLEKPLERCHTQLAQEIFLAGDMVIKRRLPYTQAGGNLTRRGSRIPLLPKQFGSLVEYSLLRGHVSLNIGVGSWQQSTAQAHGVNRPLSRTDRATVQ